MTGIWLIGWIAPAAMAAWSASATLRRHRWNIPLWVGTLVGGGFCVLAWAITHYVLRDSNESLAIAFLQIALSSAGVFVFGIVGMVSAKWMTRIAPMSCAPK